MGAVAGTALWTAEHDCCLRMHACSLLFTCCSSAVHLLFTWHACPCMFVYLLTQRGLTTSVTPIPAGVALLYGDKLGRRNELLLASGLYGKRLAVRLLQLVWRMSC